ncbi:helix-turn-helix domain-containing protein [Paracraurococcus ruber]|uniref:XRE family transcriptional regulator n=1 Tax=Paracraurococcus ruber TaxID=77675 RepID=A0ABS1CQN1_9PROT|nr:XRE family transcriptional regulator [Paracraurococcus ruber]MBK1656660.1 XRE family transcriptional regulator [Paracraurococcus ruber]TDG33719.1 XRE family transcriptional regulator [Paracraurococcus ruber]
MVNVPERPPTPGQGATLAANLRALRRDRELTLEGLAAASGVSRAMISKIERGAAVPTATVLGRLAHGLEVGLSRLLGAAQARGPVLLHPAEQPVYADAANGFERRSISPVFPDRFLDLALNRLAPGGQAVFPPHHRGVEEYLHVSRGTLEVIVDGTAFTVPAGATLFYEGDRQHEFHNRTAEPVEFLVAVDSSGAR